MVKEIHDLEGHSTSEKKISSSKSQDDSFIGQANMNILDNDVIPVDGTVANGIVLDRSTKSVPNSPYYKLSAEEKSWVHELRNRVQDLLQADYDTDFNLYRWLKSADRTSRQRGNLDLAEKMLSNHLRFRRALKLDESKIPTWDENPAFTGRYLPRGYLHYMPSSNRFLWWVDYSSIDMPGIMNTVTSTNMLIWHFWKYEHMLRVVNECERRTQSLSGVRMIMDVRDYDMNPFSLMLATNGGMTYYAQLIHYEHYPELTCPINVINVAKWLMLPYRLIRSVMPKDFNERIQVNGSNYQDALLQDIDADDLPDALGGKNSHSKELTTVKSLKIDPSEYESRKREQIRESDPTADQLATIQVAARNRKFISIDCKAGCKLKWWFRVDAEVYFGLFYMPEKQSIADLTRKDCKKDLLEKLDMVHPYFRLLTKLVPERGEHVCERSGVYILVFCNRASWVYRRNIQLKIDIDQNAYDRKYILERAFSVQ